MLQVDLNDVNHCRYCYVGVFLTPDVVHLCFVIPLLNYTPTPHLVVLFYRSRDGFYPDYFNNAGRYINEKLIQSGHLNLYFQFNMIILPHSCLLYFIITFAFVTPAPPPAPEYAAYKSKEIHKIKSKEISLVKIEDSDYLLRINFASISEKLFLLTKENIVSDDNVLTVDGKGNLSKDKSSLDTDLGVFTETDTSSSVTISYNKKTDKYSIEGILDNTWIISPLEICSPPATCDMCLQMMIHTITRVETEIVGADYKLVPEDTEYEQELSSFESSSYEN